MAGKHEKYQRLLDYCKTLPPTPTAVAHPCDDSSLEGAVGAAQIGLIAPILVGPRARIEAVAKERGLNLAGLPMEETEHSPRIGGTGRRARPRGQGPGADERKPAH
jgi:phosphate acetyltransferase